jgi:hypothetical protein
MKVMSYKKSKPKLIVVLAVLSIIPAQTNAQTRWLHYSPPDKSFTVELPRKPKYKRQKLDYEREGLFEGNSHVDWYDFSPNESGTVGVVAVYYVPQEKSQRQFDEESDSIMLVVGGDDKKFVKQESVTVNGLKGRDYIYSKGSVRGRVLIVNAGKRIFFLQYHTEAGVLPTFVAKIFDSFRIAS